MYWVYIITNKHHTTLYVGVTGFIHHRIAQHKSMSKPGFSQRYRLTKLVYLEEAEDPYSAIQREKQIKRWRRDKKVRLIESMNPEWRDIPIG